MNYQSYLFGDMSQAWSLVPMWIPQLGYSGGLVILLIAFIDELVHVRAEASRATRSRSRRLPREAVERAVQSGV
jgi:hypothetical protein